MTDTAAAQTIDAAAPYDQIPLHIRAGAIVPFGPEIQYTGEKPADPITLYVYSGSDGRFDLYEDEGTNNNYELGRVRAYADLWYDDILRVYVEYIDAQTYLQNLPPLVLEE